MNILEELRSLDPRDPGRWPLPVLRRRRGGWLPGAHRPSASTCWCGTNSARSLQQFAAEEQKLQQEFHDKHAKAVNLELYKQQLKDIERSFGALLRQLPGKTEVPSLLVDISQTGLAAGLQEKLFQPQPEQRKDFYAELPIKIRLTRQLPPVRRVRQRHRGAAAHRHAARHRHQAGQQGRLRPAVAGAHGEDLPLPGRGRDRRGRGREEEGRHAPPKPAGS